MTSATDAAPVRVLLAVGDRTLEQRLSRELPEHGVTVVRRALDGPGLLAAAMEPGIDAALIAADLHRLDEATLIALRGRRIPAVVLAGTAGHAERFAEVAGILPAGSSTATMSAAVHEAKARGAFVPTPAGTPSEAEISRTPVTPDGRGVVIAVASGKSAPGKTTVAIAIAAELGRAGASVALVDADLRGGNVAAHLDLDPRRGIVGLAASTGPLTERLDAEMQPGPGCLVLAGVERPELTASLGSELIGAVLATLRTRFERIVVDVGVPPELAALHSADEVVVVTGADLVSIWNARVALPALRANAPVARLSLLLNRAEGQEHYAPEEVAQALDLPALGAVREDRKAARRAISNQLPLSQTGGAAARDLQAAAAALRRTGNPDAARAAHLEHVGSGRLAAER